MRALEDRINAKISRIDDKIAKVNSDMKSFQCAGSIQAPEEPSSRQVDQSSGLKERMVEIEKYIKRLAARELSGVIQDAAPALDFGNFGQYPTHEADQREVSQQPGPCVLSGTKRPPTGSKTWITSAGSKPPFVGGPQAAPELSDGEQHSVPFVFRKRRQKRTQKGFATDMTFLDEISVASSVRRFQSDGDDSNDEYELSSGVDDLPDSDVEQATSTMNLRSGQTQLPWQPFPATLFRQRIVIPSPSVSSAESHLTAVRRGASLVDDRILAPGRMNSSTKRRITKGKGRNIVRWPNFGANTLKSRMDEIVCDLCKGRVHFACAGLSHGKDMSKTPWSCPPCEQLLIGSLGKRRRMDVEEVRVPSAQTERCLREDCIYRSSRKIIRKNNDVDQYFMDRIIGRKRTGWDNGKAVYKYLIKWLNWEIYDSTWEPASNIPNLSREVALFARQCKQQALDDPRLKVVLLPQAEEYFDWKGSYKLDVLERLCIERRWWWED
ncbi:hypothetical protein IAU60_002287 [Kwoniella sp. DSM 27419]